jgi:hypothetical protein
MKIQTVYKVTTDSQRSCLASFNFDWPEIIKTMALQFSTEHWTLPKDEFINSGIFVFLSLEEAQEFQDILGSYRCEIWKALAFGVRKRKYIMKTKFSLSPDFVTRYLSGRIIPNSRLGYNFDFELKNYHVADGVRLVEKINRWA